VIYEVFTWPWLTALSAGADRRVTLADVPEHVWDSLALPGVDAVWLMGVWERSPAGRDAALADPELRAARSAALPDGTDADVVGSPYCIAGYEVDARLGGREGLACARAALAERGLRLLLDFVPNHVAPDHPWVTDHPEYFVRGSEEDLATAPQAWLRTAGGIYARGRDPNFPPWRDVVQLDPMSAPLRAAAVATLNDIAGQCDGVRCDMAMLFLDEVAQRTWAGRLQPVRDQPYWSEVTTRVRQAHPDFVFLAEAYWDLEGPLLEQGIDLCYDKRLYDRLRDGDAASVHAHLLAAPRRQSRLVRFLENHDEARAASAFAPDRLRAASVALLTLPGEVLLHEGQLDGLRTRLPVELGRRPAEQPDPDVRRFWSGLLAAVAGDQVRSGDWRLLELSGWPDNQRCQNLLAWRWARHLVVINYSDQVADGLVQLGSEWAGRAWELEDVLGGERYRRDGDDLAGRGLYVALPSWGAQILRFESRSGASRD
jgi:hypothetical protein